MIEGTTLVQLVLGWWVNGGPKNGHTPPVDQAGGWVAIFLGGSPRLGGCLAAATPQTPLRLVISIKRALAGCVTTVLADIHARRNPFLLRSRALFFTVLMMLLLYYQSYALTYWIRLSRLGSFRCSKGTLYSNGVWTVPNL